MSTLIKEAKKYQTSNSLKRKEPSTSKESRNKNSNHFQDISNMHESIGNKAVGKLLSSSGIQAKLTVSQPNDSFEIEADKVADKVMSMKDTNVTARTPIQIQRKTATNNSNQELSSNTESKINSLQNNGQSLSKQTRSFFEPRFGHDFSNVKIHTDSNANSLASSINARAFTKGNHIVFNKGEYNPQSNKGKRLLGHELTHTIQQINHQNILRQKEEANTFEELNYTRITNAQQKLIDNFSKDAHKIIFKWKDLRKYHTNKIKKGISYKEYKKRVFKIQNSLHLKFKDLSNNFFKSYSITTQETDKEFNDPLRELGYHGHIVNLYNHDLAMKEIGRQLNKGYFPQYYKEIRILHKLEVPIGHFGNLPDIMKNYVDVKSPSKAHTYTLKTTFGIEGSVNVYKALSAGGFLKAFQITYTNPIGVSWKLNKYVIVGKGGAGISALPVSVNVDSSVGQDMINAGKAVTRKYYPPSYLKHNMIYMMGVEAGMAGGYSISKMMIGEITFNTSGVTVKAGTGSLFEGEMSAGLGYGFGGNSYGHTGLEKKISLIKGKKRDSNYIKTIRSRVYFKTEETKLDNEDIKSINTLNEAIVRHEKYYPGDYFVIQTIGHASEVWQYPNFSADKYNVDTSIIDNNHTYTRKKIKDKKRSLLNKKLAEERTYVVNMEITRKLLSNKNFTHGVINKNIQKIRASVIKTKDTDKDNNSPKNRYVQIFVWYDKSVNSNILYQKDFKKKKL